MAARDGGERAGRLARLRGVYLVVSLVLIALYLVLPASARPVDALVVSVGAMVPVLVGLQAMPSGGRRPWSLLLAALVVVNVANVIRFGGGDLAGAVSALVDAAGNVLVLAAALALILRRGRNDLGAVVDTTIIALAAGGLLWFLALYPHLSAQGFDLATRVNLFVVVFALAGVLGALVRLALTAGQPHAALWLFSGALSLAIVGNVMRAATTGPTWGTVGQIVFLVVYTTVGLAVLDPSAPRLVLQTPPEGEDRISARRLWFLGIAVAAIPVVIGVQALLHGQGYGLLLIVAAVAVTALVMARIGLLAAQREHAERVLRYQAAHDPLTQLPNRSQFVTRLGDELARSRRCAVLFCDLDEFKTVNDMWGHAAGDQLLIEVAHRLRGCVRGTDVVARFAGDEFLILLPGADQADAADVRARIAQATARPVRVVGGSTTVTVSVGTAIASGSTDPEDVIREADHAMYRAKRAGQSGTGQ
jgi:diguanylate cyclase (GGDEF)-like protein